MTQQPSLFSPDVSGAAELLADMSGLCVLEVAGPQSWPAARAVWEQVQSRWGWPAPALSVNGRDGFQLWFRLPEPLPQEDAHMEALFAGLKSLAGEGGAVPQAALRWTWHPMATGAVLVPPREVASEQWAAFVTRDLAPIFAETPWLDVCPGGPAQADHLSRLKAVEASAWASWLASSAASTGGADPASLSTAVGAAAGRRRSEGVAATAEGEIAGVQGQTGAAVRDGGLEHSVAASGPNSEVAVLAAGEGRSVGRHEARLWLLGVMRDESQAMVHRLEAARLLLGP